MIAMGECEAWRTFTYSQSEFFDVFHSCGLNAWKLQRKKEYPALSSVTVFMHTMSQSTCAAARLWVFWNSNVFVVIEICVNIKALKRWTVSFAEVALTGVWLAVSCLITATHLDKAWCQTPGWKCWKSVLFGCLTVTLYMLSLVNQQIPFYKRGSLLNLICRTAFIKIHTNFFLNEHNWLII